MAKEDSVRQTVVHLACLTLLLGTGKPTDAKLSLGNRDMRSSRQMITKGVYVRLGIRIMTCAWMIRMIKIKMRKTMKKKMTITRMMTIRIKMKMNKTMMIRMMMKIRMMMMTKTITYVITRMEFGQELSGPMTKSNLK